MYSCKKCSIKSIHHIEKVDIWSSPDSIVIRFLLCLLPVLRCQSWVLRFVYEHRHQKRHSHNHYRILLSLQAHFDCGCKKNGQDDSRNSRQNVRGPPPITQNISLKYLYIYMFLYLHRHFSILGKNSKLFPIQMKVVY